jgi:hypothetical protein
VQRPRVAVVVGPNHLDLVVSHLKRDTVVKGTFQGSLGTLDGDTGAVDFDLDPAGERQQ